ncbi:MAG: ABC transporter permease [Desulfitobacteriia bacterium]
MTAKRLFLDRVLREWRFHLRTLKIVVDWVISLYFIVPILVFGVATYFTWLKTPPLWLEQLPLINLAGVLVIFIIRGYIRVFMEEADKLFLFQQRQWLKEIKKMGIIYSLIINAVISSIIFLVLTPFLLLQYKVGPYSIAVWCILVVILKTMSGVGKQLAGYIFSGWRLRLIIWLIYSLIGSYYFISLMYLEKRILFSVLTLISIIVFILFTRRLLDFPNTFCKDIIREKFIKYRFVNFIMSASGYDQRKSIILFRKRPLFFRSSGHIYKQRTTENILAETFLKTTLRNSKDILYMFQTVIICTLFSLALPKGWKWAGLIVFAFLFVKICGLCWGRGRAKDFFKMFPWRVEDIMKAGRKVNFLLFSLFFLPVSFTLGITHSRFGVLIFIILGELIGYFLIRINQLFKTI